MQCCIELPQIQLLKGLGHNNYHYGSVTLIIIYAFVPASMHELYFVL